jgi:hypothetical protein
MLDPLGDEESLSEVTGRDYRNGLIPECARNKKGPQKLRFRGRGKLST